MLPLVIRVEDLQSGAVSKAAFIKSPVRIGRSELNDLPLSQGFVSQWHAIVQFDDTEVRYVDLGSTNGSMVNGVRIERNVPVPIGGDADVRIGALKLSFARRATGEHRAPSRTMFAMRAATAFGPAAAAPGAAPGDGDAPGAGIGPGVSRLAAATPPSSAEPPPPSAPPAPPRLDLPTEFRVPVARTPGPTSPPPAAPSLDLPTEFRRVAAPEGGSAPASAGVPLTPAAAPQPPSSARGAWAPPSEIERLVTTFAESYLPASVRIGGFDDAQAFLAKLAEALEAFARAFVEMRKGYEEFGKQMGIRTVHGDGPLLRARDPRQLISLLLDPGQEGRASELQASFADYMVHQVALLNGVLEGAKAILAELSPERIEAQAPQSRWPLKAQTLWKTFEGRFHELFEEDAAISDALFGREFGKAYTAIVGRRGAVEPDDGDGDEDDDGDAPPRGAGRKGRGARRR